MDDDEDTSELSNLVGGLTPTERVMRARLAAHTMWANTTDRSARTKAGRDAFLDSFEKKADPDGTMDPRERFIKAEHLRKAHFQRLALKSAQVRRQRKERGQ